VGKSPVSWWDGWRGLDAGMEGSQDTHGRAEGELRVGTSSSKGGRAGGNTHAAPGSMQGSGARQTLVQLCSQHEKQAG